MDDFGVRKFTRKNGCEAENDRFGRDCAEGEVLKTSTLSHLNCSYNPFPEWSRSEQVT